MEFSFLLLFQSPGSPNFFAEAPAPLINKCQAALHLFIEGVFKFGVGDQMAFIMVSFLGWPPYSHGLPLFRVSCA
jgi:hypothetical protein